MHDRFDNLEKLISTLNDQSVANHETIIILQNTVLKKTTQ